MNARLASMRRDVAIERQLKRDAELASRSVREVPRSIHEVTRSTAQNLSAK